MLKPTDSPWVFAVVLRDWSRAEPDSLEGTGPRTEIRCLVHYTASGPFRLEYVATDVYDRGSPYTPWELQGSHSNGCLEQAVRALATLEFLKYTPNLEFSSWTSKKNG